MRLIVFLLKCLVGLLASLGFFIVAASIALIVFVSRGDYQPWETGPDEVPDQAVLLLDLANGVIEAVPANPLARATMGDVLVLPETVAALEAAAKDDRIKGVVARLGRGDPGLAQVQELRDAIAAFRARDKFAVAFAETFGEGGHGTLHYYLASAFEQVWVQPSGDLSVTGLAIETPFLREALDDIGVLPRLDHRDEYKGVSSTFTDSEMPEPVRRNLQALMDSWLGQIVEGIAESRGLQPAAVRAMIDRAPHRAAEAEVLGLVDRVGYWDELVGETLDKAGEAAAFLGLRDYAALSAEEPAEDAPLVALIQGLGPVVLDGSRNDPVFDEVSLGSDTVAQAIADAIDHDEVAAIVFRVDSPGGSYVASDTIWREVVRAREEGVPLIVTMGNVAASGGYFVAMAADKIVAQPGTVTGSIGVAAGKVVLAELWDDLGIQWDGVAAGRNAAANSIHRDFTPAQWVALQGTLDAIYEDFTSKVAEGRALTREQTLAAAKGQVWSGSDAKARGLVDSLGGYSQAFALAREAAGLAPDQPLNIRSFPESRDPFSAFLEDSIGLEGAFENGAVASLARGLARLYEVLAPVLATYDRLTADPGSPQLRAPDVSVR